MTTETETNTNTGQAEPDNTNNPDWIAKSARGFGRNQRLERIGVAWTRADGGIGVRLVGKQLVEGDIYLYPNTAQED